MQEGENFAQYFSRIKDFVNTWGMGHFLRGFTGKIDDDIVLSKVLRILLPIYAIRVYEIQELR